MNSSKRESQFVKHLDFTLIDLAILEFSFWAMTLIYSEGLRNFTMSEGLLLRQRGLMAVSLMLIIFFRNPYHRILRRNVWTEMKQLFVQTIAVFIVNVIMLFFFRESWWISRGVMVLTYATYFILAMTVRVLWKRLLRRHLIKKGKIHENNMIVICSHHRAPITLDNLKTDHFARYKIAGFFLIDYDEDRDRGQEIGGIPILGKDWDAIDYATHNWVDEVFLNLRHHQKLSRSLDSHFQKMGIPTHRVMLRLTDYEDHSIPSMEQFGNYIVATRVLREVPYSQKLMKRTLDICGAIVGLILTGIVYLFIAPQIKRADPGPVFYASKRVGKNGRIFKMYKFRSMYQDADARKAELMSQNKMKGFMFKMDDDPRIIGSEKKDQNGKPAGIGNFIRKTSLDEFPQFLNVLKGDMSLVGTRPPTPDEWIQYSEEHRIRLSVRPGITGMWQVSGRSDITDFEEVVRLDEEYIETWTVAKDIKILMMTVLQVLRHKGAE